MLNVTARKDVMRKNIETLNVVVEDARFDFGENGLQVRVVDPSHVAMIQMDIDAAAFDTWELDSTSLGLEIRKIKELVGPDSPEWKALKEEAFLRLVKPTTTGNVRDAAGDIVFSGDKFSTSLRKALRDSPDLWGELFSRREIDLLRQFENVALRATGRREGAVNHSGTSYPLGQWLTSFMGQTPAGRAMLGVASKILGGINESGQAAKAIAATSGEIPLAASRIPPAAAVGAATGASQIKERRTPRAR